MFISGDLGTEHSVSHFSGAVSTSSSLGRIGMPGSYMEDVAESFARDIDSAEPLPPFSALCLSCHLGLSLLILCHSDLPVVNSY